ncbi:MAG: homogentisate phytyltransferase [Bacteroidota bacterium]
MITTFLRFARLHTLVGTTLSITALFFIAARVENQYYWVVLLLTLASCLAANVYITGLNQITDVEIDRINKPYLPIASGDYTIPQAQRIVFVCLGLALFGGLIGGWFLLLTIVVSVLIGTAYSVPPIRLKRFPFWAAFCILAVRGLVVNILLYLHFDHTLNRAVRLPAEVQILTAIIFGYSLLIAWFKDLPDTKGDEAFGIRTLSISWGKQQVWLAGSWLFGLGLLGAAAYLIWGLDEPTLGYGQLGLLLIYFIMARGVDLENQKSIARFYQGFWGLFFGEYLLFAMVA